MRVVKCLCWLVVGSHIKDKCTFLSIAFVNARRIQICAQQSTSRAGLSQFFTAVTSHTRPSTMFSPFQN